MAITQRFLPKIYFLAPRLLGSYSSASLKAILAHCAGMGFDSILVPSGAQASDSTAREIFSTLAQACRQENLALYVDLDASSAGVHSALSGSHPEWFAQAEQSDDLPDPRYPVRLPSNTQNRLRYTQNNVADEITVFWQQLLRTWVDAGVDGVRCMGIGEPPASFWTKLIGAAREYKKEIRFLAWTPGCTAEQVEALAGCGFDATFSSGAWWDYRSRWLVEEYARLNRIAPPIALPDMPTESVLKRACGEDSAAQCRQRYTRALQLAAATGNGLLMPMGFEFGQAAFTESRGDQLNQGALEAMQGHAPFDISAAVTEANAFVMSQGAALYGGNLRMLSGPDSAIAALLRQPALATAKENVKASKETKESVKSKDAIVILANANALSTAAMYASQLIEHADGYVTYKRLWPEGTEGSAPSADAKQISLDAGNVQVFAARKLPQIGAKAGIKQSELKEQREQKILTALQAPRIAIESISPAVDAGQFPVKRTVGESVAVEADVFGDGHDKLAVSLLWRAADEENWQEVRMRPLGNDRWSAVFPLTRVGRYVFTVEAWRDVFATYRDELEKKTSAGLNVELELEEGRLLVQAAAENAQKKRIPGTAAPFKALAQVLNKSTRRGAGKVEISDAERVAALLSEPTAEAMRLADARQFAVRAAPELRIDAERKAARFSSWYELFPRSQSGDPARHGTFADVERRLPAIAAMGFDTLYFTPIHPIGKKHRKGRNNSLTPADNDPGSPYAIGSEQGGHDAIHPELGTLEDFRHLRDAAAQHGLELALDFAIQCSPDHPWLKEHPEWFAWRPDGSIRYAENPPKKYQDIVNVDFYAEGAMPGLWIALRDAVLFWVKEGVRVFRVDNPHTKPLPFWEWMIDDIRSQYPDTIFLSEAFTRPKVMYRLAKVGYSQSYTYFTWRHTRQEFIDYMTELTTTSVSEYFRPHFFVNTPDINPYFLHNSGRPGFLIRTALATLLSGLWGMYSGFELCEAMPVPGKEEYLDSEKYEIRAWQWQRPGNIIAEITQFNRLRAENPALQSHMGIRFLQSSDSNILYFMKSSPPVDPSQRIGDNVILAAINLDPFAAHETSIELPLWEFGLPDDGVLHVDDLIHGGNLAWRGKQQQLRLDPFVCPYAVWRISSNRQKGV